LLGLVVLLGIFFPTLLAFSQDTNELPLSAEFIEYIKAAANPGKHGQGKDGRFYGEENVRLWCPPDLLEIDNPEVEWLAAWGNGKLYLAFLEPILPQRASKRPNQPQTRRNFAGSDPAFLGE
jgi:hypothetical protein